MGRAQKITYKGIQFDSKAEYEFGLTLEARGLDLATSRESQTLEYTVPERTRNYSPDFSIGACHLEYKGRLTKFDRDKLIQVRDSQPSEQLILVFQRSANTIRKGSGTTYGTWATKNGFEWYNGSIPNKRLEEIIKSANKQC